jgi:hypothetical protein
VNKGVLSSWSFLVHGVMMVLCRTAFCSFRHCSLQTVLKSTRGSGELTKVRIVEKKPDFQFLEQSPLRVGKISSSLNRARCVWKKARVFAEKSSGFGEKRPPISRRKEFDC